VYRICLEMTFSDGRRLAGTRVGSRVAVLDDLTLIEKSSTVEVMCLGFMDRVAAKSRSHLHRPPILARR
jgi:hypothetical protein